MKMALPIFVAHYCSETITTCTVGTGAHEPAGLKTARPQPGYVFPPGSLMPGFIQVLPVSAVLQLLLTIDNRELTVPHRLR